MSLGKKLMWGSLGWVLGGPIGGILGYAFASMNEGESSWDSYRSTRGTSYPKTKPADFIISLLVLFAKVMKADNQL